MYVLRTSTYSEPVYMTFSILSIHGCALGRRLHAIPRCYSPGNNDFAASGKEPDVVSASILLSA